MAMKNLRGRVAFKFDEVDFDVDQIVGVKNIKTTNIDELSRAAMQEATSAKRLWVQFVIVMAP